MIVKPIAGENPMGGNINYDADFDACKNEIGKLGGIDYALVESSCTKLLTGKSKDIRLLCFLSFVYLRDEKWEFFSDIFDGFVKLAQQNYDAMFPDRERAKQNAIKWLAEIRYNETIAEKKPAEIDYPHISRLLASLTSLKTILQEKFPEGSPFPTGLFTAVQNWEKTCKPKPKVEATSASSSTAAGTTADPMDTPKQAQTIVRKAANFLIEKEPQKPMGFRINRTLRWDIFEKSPPAENGKTQLAPPPADLATTLNTLINNKEFKPALDKAELAFSAGANHLWFGLQRLAAMACAGLGEPYKPVEQAILYETGLFVRRIPEILNLNFSDGSPFCDDVTKEWIAKSVMPLFSSESAASQKKESEENLDKVEEVKKQVAALISSNKTEAALDVLQNAIRNSSNERDNFRRSIIMCNMLLGAKQPDIALSILDSLDAKIQLYHLDKWDPDLAVDAWSIMVRVLKVARASKPAPVQATMTEKQNTILSKISQIDPKKAFSLNT